MSVLESTLMLTNYAREKPIISITFFMMGLLYEAIHQTKKCIHVYTLLTPVCLVISSADFFQN